MLIPAEVASFAMDPSGAAPLVILRESAGERTLPIIVGPSEASAIAIKTLNVDSQRPVTVDLLKMVMHGLNGRLERAVIYDLRESIYYARLHIVIGERVLAIDCRPSDAIALAQRCHAPLFIDEIVFEKNGTSVKSSEAEKIRTAIAELDTVDFGRYHLD